MTGKSPDAFKTGTLGKDEQDVQERLHLHRYPYMYLRDRDKRHLMRCVECGKEFPWPTNGEGRTRTTS